MITRQEIQDSIASILDRQDLNGEISRWFRRAHYHTQQRHNFLAMQLSAFTGMTEGQNRFEVPDGFKNDISLYVYDPFRAQTIRTFAKADIETVRGERQFNIYRSSSIFALWSNVFEIDPPISASEAGYQLRLDYHAFLTPPELDGDDFFTNNAESWLIYRALRESAPFLGADTRLPTWMKLETDAWTSLYNSDIEARNTGGHLVMRG